MIANLLKTILLTIGLGANVNQTQTPNFNIQKKDRIQTRDYETITLSIQNEDVSFNNYNNTNIQNIDYRYSKKTTLSGRTNKLNINATRYEQGYFIEKVDDDYSYYYSYVKKQNTNTDYYWTTLTYLEIYTEGSATNQQLALDLNTQFDFQNMEGQYTQQEYEISSAIYKTNIYVFSDPIIQTNYSNNQNWNTDKWTINEIKKIENNRYNYYQTDETQDRADSQWQVNIYNPITITNNTTYLLIAEEIIINYTGTQTKPLIYHSQVEEGISIPNLEMYSFGEDYIDYLADITASQMTIEIIDIPSVMFDILVAPFTFYSVAFNLTLFPGTQYQVNVSNLILTVVGVLIFIWIVGKIINLRS